jgi:Zn-dependent protease/predicted transcriptional regulator
METRTSRLFEILGFQIKVHASWFLIAALMIWSLASGFFPEEVPGLTTADYLALSVAGVLGLFASLILHELAHSLVARQFGLGVGGITLFMFGGVAELDEEPSSPKSEFWVAIAGPTTSLGVAALAWIGLFADDGVVLSQALQSLLSYLWQVNLALALFNLVPAFPLDGGRILRAGLWHRWADLIRATRAASKVGEAFAILLIFIGFLVLLSDNTFGGIWPILIGLFLQSAARTTYQQLLVRSALAGKTVDAMMTPAPWTADPNQTLSDVVDDVMLRHSVSFVPVCEGDHVLGYIDAQTVNGIDRENWPTTHVADVLTAVDNEIAIPPDLPTEVLVQMMMQCGRRKYLVAKQHRLLGVITFSDLMSYLSVLHDLGAFRAPPTRREKQQEI